MKTQRILALVFALLLSLSGCSRQPVSADMPVQRVIFTDDCSREVTVPAEINRIAATGPLAQITLYTIAPDLLVGLSADWSDSAREIIPEKYLRLPYFGQLYNTANLNVEELALANPQVIVDIGRVMPAGAEDLDTLQLQTGIPTVFLASSAESMPQIYRALGRLLNRQKEADELAAFCQRVYLRTLSVMEQVGDDKVTALYIKGEQGLNVLAQGSPHAQTLDLLTHNLAVAEVPSSKGSGNEVTMEQIALWDPELILFDRDSIYDTVSGMETWSELSAIQSGHYLEVPDCPWNWMGTPPAPQRILGMIWLTAQLYPEYCDYDVKAEILEFYELFCHCTLTEQQYNQITANAFLE